MLPTNFRFIWPIGFREKDHLEIDQSETRIVYGGHVLMDRDNMSNLYRCLLPSFSPRGFRGKDLEKSSNQKQELPVAAMFVDESERNEHSL